MTDRVPGAPGQYKAVVTADELVKMQSGEPFTITMTRDDQPITEGTPYSKAAVLPDSLALEICPEVEDPTPADALQALLPKHAASVLLWQNPNPKTAFEPQTIELDLSKYRYVIITHHWNTVTLESRNPAIVFVGGGLSFHVDPSFDYHIGRQFTATETGVTVGEGKQLPIGETDRTAIANNAYIPIEIYGCV